MRKLALLLVGGLFATAVFGFPLHTSCGTTVEIEVEKGESFESVMKRVDDIEKRDCGSGILTVSSILD